MLKNDAFVKIKLEKELCKDDCEKQEKMKVNLFCYLTYKERKENVFPFLF